MLVCMSTDACISYCDGLEAIKKKYLNKYTQKYVKKKHKHIQHFYKLCLASHN